MSSQDTRKSVNTAGAVVPLKDGDLAGWAVYFGKGDPLNNAGHVSNGPATEENASLEAIIHALRILRKKDIVEGTHFRVLTASEVAEQAHQSGASGKIGVLQEELAMLEKDGYDILLDKLQADSKDHEECMSMATHAAQTQRQNK